MHTNIQNFQKRTRINYNHTNNNNMSKDEDEDDDRLSSLPDPILVDILSLIPFNSAVTTGILSRRWFRLWTQLTHLRIYSDNVIYGSYSKYFTSIDHALKHLSSRLINIFDYHFHHPPIDCYEIFKFLIRQICDRLVKEFKVKFSNSDLYRLTLLPSFVLETQSLQVLVLGFGFDFRLPNDGVNLPNLRKLDICIYDHQLLFMAKLVKSCPQLQDLRIHGDLRDYEHSLDISASNLKSLRINMANRLKNTKVVIDAPKLENFNVSGPNLLSYSFSKTPNALLKVEVCTTFNRGVSDKGCREWELVRSVSNARSLILQGDISPAFYYMKDYALPVFHGLTTLELALHFPTYWKALMRFLEFCPNLQIVRLRKKGFAWYGTGWIKLDDVPACVVTKVKSIILRDLQGMKQELELLRYILLVANVLETLHLKVAFLNPKKHRNLQLCKEFEFCQELYRFPKSSLNCQIKVANQNLPQ